MKIALEFRTHKPNGILLSITDNQAVTLELHQGKVSNATLYTLYIIKVIINVIIFSICMHWNIVSYLLGFCND